MCFINCPPFMAHMIHYVKFMFACMSLGRCARLFSQGVLPCVLAPHMLNSSFQASTQNVFQDCCWSKIMILSHFQKNILHNCFNIIKYFAVNVCVGV
jgi:hypothetical protein